MRAAGGVMHYTLERCRQLPQFFCSTHKGCNHFVNSYWGRISGTIGIESIAVEIGASQWETRIQPEENPQII